MTTIDLRSLLRNIKVSVDQNRKPGRFTLTGSANLLLLPQTSESLAGRMEIIQMHPLTEAEKEGGIWMFWKSYFYFANLLHGARTGQSVW